MADLWRHTADRDGDTYTVALAGELDMSAFDALVKILTDAAEQPGITMVRVDLGDVGFIDSTGMQALLAGLQATQRTGVKFALIQPRGHVRKVLQIAGLLDLLSGDEPYPSAM